MTLLISSVFSVLICLLVFIALMWVKTPYYRLGEKEVAQLLEWVLLGQASQNDWQVFCEMPIRHNELLESIRLRCQDIDEASGIGDGSSGFLLNRKGLNAVQELLGELHAAESSGK